MLNIVIPMAGKGQRFRDCGYQTPKPFIEVNGKPMIVRVIDNLIISQTDFKFHLVCLPEHAQLLWEELYKQDFEKYVNIIPLLEESSGAVCSVLNARNYIDNENPLMIASCDQLVEFSADDFIQKVKGLEGALVTYKSTKPYHSFCKLNEKGLVVEVAEKKPVSDNANAGIYYFGKGEDFITAAELMIDAKDTYNNEYYNALVYNHLIKMGKTNIKLYEVTEEQVHILGTPVELRKYLKHV